MKHLFALIFLICAPLASAADSYTPYAGGKALIQQYCISCHASSFGGDGSGIYTREYRKVRSMAGLKAQVTSCNTMLNLKWFDDEEQQVVQYLNAMYYHF